MHDVPYAKPLPRLRPLRLLAGTLGLLLAGAIQGFLIYWIAQSQNETTRFVVPGKHDVVLDHSGEYILYYEYISIVGGEVFRTSPSPPGLRCEVTRREGQSEIALRQSSWTTSYKSPKRAGVELFRFSVVEPGDFVLEVQYDEGSDSPPIALALTASANKSFFFVAVAGIIAAVFTQLAIAWVVFLPFLRTLGR